MSIHTPPAVLLADIFEIMGSAVALIALIGWIIRQIAEANKQAPQPPRGRQPIAPARPQAAAGEMPKGGQQADPLRNQVEEFLRRAGGKPANHPGAPQPPRQPQPAAAGGVELLIDEERTYDEARSFPEPLRHRTPSQPAEQPLAKPAKRRAITPSKRVTLAERAAQREGERARRLGEHASQLGKRIVAEDQLFDVQLQAKFDHAVGTLAGETRPVSEQRAAATDSPAAQIAAMLASPGGVRQAMVLNEILRRPSDRW